MRASPRIGKSPTRVGQVLIFVAILALVALLSVALISFMNNRALPTKLPEESMIGNLQALGVLYLW